MLKTNHPRVNQLTLLLFFHYAKHTISPRTIKRWTTSAILQLSCLKCRILREKSDHMISKQYNDSIVEVSKERFFKVSQRFLNDVKHDFVGQTINGISLFLHMNFRSHSHRTRGIECLCQNSITIFLQY